eukprot:Rhum_TRINITY_DN11812_c0_g1::Rhum_TRINITY_DN11812_c0_g1_i1::g.47231::m.47231
MRGVGSDLPKHSLACGARCLPLGVDFEAPEVNIARVTRWCAERADHIFHAPRHTHCHHLLPHSTRKCCRLVRHRPRSCPSVLLVPPHPKQVDALQVTPRRREPAQHHRGLRDDIVLAQHTIRYQTDAARTEAVAPDVNLHFLLIHPPPLFSATRSHNCTVSAASSSVVVVIVVVGVGGVHSRAQPVQRRRDPCIPRQQSRGSAHRSLRPVRRSLPHHLQREGQPQLRRPLRHIEPPVGVGPHVRHSPRTPVLPCVLQQADSLLGPLRSREIVPLPGHARLQLSVQQHACVHAHVDDRPEASRATAFSVCLQSVVVVPHRNKRALAGGAPTHVRAGGRGIPGNQHVKERLVGEGPHLRPAPEPTFRQYQGLHRPLLAFIKKDRIGPHTLFSRSDRDGGVQARHQRFPLNQHRPRANGRLPVIGAHLQLVPPLLVGVTVRTLEELQLGSPEPVQGHPTLRCRLRTQTLQQLRIPRGVPRPTLKLHVAQRGAVTPQICEVVVAGLGHHQRNTVFPCQADLSLLHKLVEQHSSCAWRNNHETLEPRLRWGAHLYHGLVVRNVRTDSPFSLRRTQLRAGERERQRQRHGAYPRQHCGDLGRVATSLGNCACGAATLTGRTRQRREATLLAQPAEPLLRDVPTDNRLLLLLQRTPVAAHSRLAARGIHVLSPRKEKELNVSGVLPRLP